MTKPSFSLSLQDVEKFSYYLYELMFADWSSLYVFDQMFVWQKGVCMKSVAVLCSKICRFSFPIFKNSACCNFNIISIKIIRLGHASCISNISLFPFRKMLCQTESEACHNIIVLKDAPFKYIFILLNAGPEGWTSKYECEWSATNKDGTDKTVTSAANKLIKLQLQGMYIQKVIKPEIAFYLFIIFCLQKWKTEMTNDATERPHFRASNTVILSDAVRIVEITVSLQRAVFSLEQVTV